MAQFAGEAGNSALVERFTARRISCIRSRRAVRRSGARALPGRDCAALFARMDRLSLDRRRLWRPGGTLGRREPPRRSPTARGPRRGSKPSRRGLPSAKRPASRCKCSASPASMGPAAACSTNCATARRGASRRTGRCSAASMSRTSPRARSLDRAAARRRDLQRRRRRAGRARRCRGLCGGADRGSPPPEVAFAEADLTPMARSFYEGSRRIANTRIKSELGVKLRYPTYREGLASLLRARERDCAPLPARRRSLRGGADLARATGDGRRP